MDTGFANGYVVGDSHTVQGSISPLSDIYIVPSVVKYVESLLFPWRHSNEMTLLWILVIGTDCIRSCRSKYHALTIIRAP